MDPDQLQFIFKKPLSNTDISERLAFPVSLINYIRDPNDPQLVTEFRVIDRFGKGWDLQAHMRWDRNHHLKPEVYGPEWKRFVRAKELRVGDELFFYRPPDPSPSNLAFVVSIKRSIELLGKTVSGHIAV